MAAVAEKASISGYFRNLFAEHPDLLKDRSNDEILKKWMKDHDAEEVPLPVRQSLANVKSILRAKAGGKPVARKSTKPKKAVAAKPQESSQENGQQPVNRITNHVRQPMLALSEWRNVEIGLDGVLATLRSSVPETHPIVEAIRKARNAAIDEQT